MKARESAAEAALWTRVFPFCLSWHCKCFPEAKKERESREKAKAFLAAEGQGLRL